MHDKKQFETLFRSHYGQMLRLAMLLLKDDEEAKDVVSDIFARVWDGTVNAEVTQPKSYLLMCVRNRCIDRINHKKMKERVCQLLTLDSQPMITTTEETFTDLEQLKVMVDTRLTSRDRQVLLMKYERKMKYREIAAELNISEAAVYKHLSQALKILKTNLNEK
jgi:RNA polymerase sigma-70 factor (family 1)